MRPDQVYASFVIRLWYRDDRDQASGSAVALRGQITHVQSGQAVAFQELEEIAQVIAAQLLGSLSSQNIEEDIVSIREERETLSAENVIGNPGGKHEN